MNLEPKNCPICSSSTHRYPTSRDELRDCHARLRVAIEVLRLEAAQLRRDRKILHTALLEQGWKGEP